MTLTIRAFTPAFQTAARSLVLDGMREHWGEIDASLNDDLTDIATTFANDVFLLACSDAGELVGTAGLRVRAPEGEIVRMSVRTDRRRAGVGRQLFDAVVVAARSRGVTRLVLETQAVWSDVRAFYESLGFGFTHYAEGEFGTDAWYRKDIA